MKKRTILGLLMACVAGGVLLAFAFPAIAAEAGKQGVNWKDYIYRIINFAILIFLLFKLLRKPLTEFLEKRHLQVKEELQKARELSEAAEKLYQDAQQRLANMDKEIQSIREQMLKEVEEEKKRLMEEAEKKAAIMRAQAEQELTEEMEQLKEKLREKVALEALALAEKLVRKSITPEDQKRLLDLYVQQLGRLN